MRRRKEQSFGAGGQTMEGDKETEETEQVLCGTVCLCYKLTMA